MVLKVIKFDHSKADSVQDWIIENFLLVLKALKVEEVSGLARAQVLARALWA